MRTRLLVFLVAGWVLFSAAPALASTFTVTNLRSTGPGSLSAEVAAADSDSSPPTVVDFAPGLSGVINLHGGTLTLSQSMGVGGSSGVIIDGDGNEIFSVSGSTNVSISDLELTGGEAGANPGGGAILNEGTLTVSNSVFAGNASGGPGGSGTDAGAGEGGAITNIGSLTIDDSSFIDNTAGGSGGSGPNSGLGQGGAIENAGQLSITGSTFTGNTAGGAGSSGTSSGAGVGGAIDEEAPAVTVTIADSTFTGNTAGGPAGSDPTSGIGFGGAIEDAQAVSLTGDTIDANAVGAPGSAGAGIDVHSGATIAVTDTIVSENTGALNCSGSTSGTASLEWPSEGSCGFDLPSADPRLGALADNGGPTQTQALGVGSAAIAAVTSAANCPATDQRGSLRPAGGCDVGAYEVDPPTVGGASASGVGVSSASLAATVSNPDVQAGTVSFQYGTSTSYGTTTAGQGLTAGASATSFAASLTGLAPGATYHFRVVAQNPDGTSFGPDEQFTTASPPAPAAPSAGSSSQSPPSNLFTFGRPIVGSGGRITLPVGAPGAGTFTAHATFVVRVRHSRRTVTTTFTYGTARLSSTGEGAFRLVIGLSPRRRAS